jgi:hypothetical protein
MHAIQRLFFPEKLDIKTGRERETDLQWAWGLWHSAIIHTRTLHGVTTQKTMTLNIHRRENLKPRTFDGTVKETEQLMKSEGNESHYLQPELARF